MQNFVKAFQLRKQISKSLKCAPLKVKSITGQYLPNTHRVFSNFDVYAGRMIHLYNPDSSTREHTKSTFDELHMVIDNADVALMDDLVSYYEKALCRAMQIGLLYLPCVYKRYDLLANIKSNFGDYDINYSPVITEVTPVSSIKDIATIFANAVKNNTACGCVCICVEDNVQENFLSNYCKIFSDFSNIYNKYLINEFNEKRNNVKYQHRNDFDPSLF